MRELLRVFVFLFYCLTVQPSNVLMSGTDLSY